MLLDKGAGEVVIKLGGRGSLVYAVGERIATPAFEIAVKDTTGAGDCFAAGFLAALRRGLDYPAAARVANAVGAMSVESLGAVAASGTGTRRWPGSRPRRSLPDATSPAPARSSGIPFRGAAALEIGRA